MPSTGISWGLGAAGFLASMALMLAVAAKWKLPLKPTLIGTTPSALVAALPFVLLYGHCKTNWAIVLALLAQIGLALACALALAMQRFWRDPERIPPEQKGVVLSAADGQVLYVRTVADSSTPLATKHGRDFPLKELAGAELLADGAHVIGVEMNLLNVHVNRCPIGGEVMLLRHIKGKFISLRADEAPFVNERLTTVIEGPALTVAVVQVASRLVRRVVGYLSVGQMVAEGQRLGMIRFGSLVAVILPAREDVRVAVKAGDNVTAGVSILARYAIDDRRADR
jgi:phosphatidylserine decarboxylase